MENEGVI